MAWCLCEDKNLKLKWQVNDVWQQLWNPNPNPNMRQLDTLRGDIIQLLYHRSKSLSHPMWSRCVWTTSYPIGRKSVTSFLFWVDMSNSNPYHMCQNVLSVHNKIYVIKIQMLVLPDILFWRGWVSQADQSPRCKVIQEMGEREKKKGSCPNVLKHFHIYSGICNR